MMTRINPETLFIVLLLSFTAALYLPALQNEFTNWDDDIHILNNPVVKNADWKAVISPSEKYMFHPATIGSYVVEYYFWKDNPLPFHAVNIIIHLFNIILVFIFVSKALQNNTAAMLTALFFALHPLQVEPVAWISGRKELLVAFFSLLAITFFLRKTEGRCKKALYGLSIIFYCLALLSMPSAAVLPPLIAAAIWHRDGKIDHHSIVRLVPFIILAAAGSAMTLYAQSVAPEYMVLILTYSFWERIVLICSAFLFFIGKGIVPVNLSAYYGYPDAVTAIYLLQPVLLMAIIIAVTASSRLRKMIGPGLFWFAIALLPVLQIIPFNNASLTADRYFYFSSIGFFASAALLFQKLWNISDRQKGLIRVVLSLSLILYISFSVFQTIRRIPVWKNGITLFSDVIEKNPRAAIAYNNRGYEKMSRGDIMGGFIDCSYSIILKKSNPFAYYNRGNARSLWKDYPAAIADYDTALQQNPHQPNAYYNRGNAKSILGDGAGAMDDFDKAIAIRPAESSYYYSRGVTLAARFGRLAEAEEDFSKAAELNPLSADAWSNRAAMKVLRKEYAGAKEDYLRALAIQPDLAAAKDGLRTIEGK